jgi:hypothetical protein
MRMRKNWSKMFRIRWQGRESVEMLYLITELSSFPHRSQSVPVKKSRTVPRPFRSTTANLPRDETHAQESAEAAEDQSHNSSGRKATRQWCGAFVFASKVQQVKSVACCITLDRCATVVTGFVVIVGDLQGFLQL